MFSVVLLHAADDAYIGSIQADNSILLPDTGDRLVVSNTSLDGGQETYQVINTTIYWWQQNGIWSTEKIVLHVLSVEGSY
jgi:hypothetical protein